MRSSRVLHFLQFAQGHFARARLGLLLNLLPVSRSLNPSPTWTDEISLYLLWGFYSRSFSFLSNLVRRQPVVSAMYSNTFKFLFSTLFCNVLFSNPEEVSHSVSLFLFIYFLFLGSVWSRPACISSRCCISNCIIFLLFFCKRFSNWHRTRPFCRWRTWIHFIWHDTLLFASWASFKRQLFP